MVTKNFITQQKKLTTINMAKKNYTWKVEFLWQEIHSFNSKIMRKIFHLEIK